MRKLANDELGRLSADEFKKSNKLPLVIVLDDVRSMHNVGSVFRTADALAIEALYLCGITAPPPHREIEKTALGATQTVQWKYFESVMLAIEQLQHAGYRVFSIEQVENGISLSDFSPTKNEKYAFVFGNEVNGVSDGAIKQSENCIEIPQFGTKHSFNIAVSMGIVSWDFFSKSRP